MTTHKKPNRTQARQNETRAFELRARGLTLRAIAKELGLSPEGVRKVLKRVDDRELAALSESYQNLKVAQDSRLETIISESFEAWFKSKEPLRRVRQTTNAEGEEVTVNEAIEREGTVAYLDRARAALADQRSLWGLDVQAQEQEEYFNIADITRAIVARSDAYDRRLAEESAKPDPTPDVHEDV